MLNAPALVRLCLVGLLLLVSSAKPSAQVTRWQVEGETREALVFGPNTASHERPAPLVMSFHGFGDNMQNFRHTNIHETWPEAIVVYFQGLVRRQGMLGWQVERDDIDRDLKLVDVALSALREAYNIDDHRIYATGFSNGGMFTYLLWAERPELFAAFAPVAARLPSSVRPTRPKPVFHVAGVRDQVVRFADQQAAIEIARTVNGSGPPGPCGDGCIVYGAGSSAPVMAWIHSGAHVYPRRTTEQIVAFFRDHTRAP